MNHPEWLGLMQEIVKEPHNPTHRLIAADWLEEHGDEERAEFIRLGVEIGDDILSLGCQEDPGCAHSLGWDKNKIEEVGCINCCKWIELKKQYDALLTEQNFWKWFGNCIPAKTIECVVTHQYPDWPCFWHILTYEAPFKQRKEWHIKIDRGFISQVLCSPIQPDNQDPYKQQELQRFFQQPLTMFQQDFRLYTLNSGLLELREKFYHSP